MVMLSTQSQTGSTMEDEAFAQLLIQRTKAVEWEDTVLFELYDLQFAEGISENCVWWTCRHPLNDDLSARVGIPLIQIA